ncbi:MAG: DUF192 domain-containing protein [Ideonella sp.]|jgi:uncharacterized protein|nr:DUF192 domain-containing protein [Ideonella sp.]
MIYVKTVGLAVRFTAIGLLVLNASCAWAQGQPQSLPTVTLHAGMHNIRAQVAMTPDQHQVGLMFRKDMPSHEGMLFIFDRATPQCFWMRNTLLPLTIAFVRDDGVITNLDDMQPLTEDSHCSSEPVRYVLEMNLGWFAKRGFKAGARLTGAPFTLAIK